MEWCEIIQTLASIVILVSFVAIILVCLLDEIIKKSTKETNKEKEKTKDNTKSIEHKQTTKVVIFRSCSILTYWFDAIGRALYNMDVGRNIYCGLHRIEIGNTTIYFMTNYQVNETWFTLPKDTLYYLTAEYDLDADFYKAFQSIVFTKDGYCNIDDVRKVLHL